MKILGVYFVAIITAVFANYNMRLFNTPFKPATPPVSRSPRKYYVKDFERNFTFPNGFLFGAGTSAYQIEGAWNIDGKGVNIWDKLTHDFPEHMIDGTNGDEACDSYYLYKEDVKAARQLGLQFYRFSISWSRILPHGHIHVVNQAGIDYYNNLINELLINKIRPLVTIYHWDLPQPLQDLGGWTNPKMADYFEDFAYLVFSQFGDRVKAWVTFNEPDTFYRGYGKIEFAPGVGASGIGEYLATKTILLAHAKAYHLYQAYFKETQGGKLGTALNIHWCEPLRNKTEDFEACEQYQQFRLGIWAHPIYSPNGDYPEIVKDIVAQRSKQEGFRKSRLPILSNEEVEYIKGTWDFFGVNHYTTVYGTFGEEGDIPSINRDCGVLAFQDNLWPGSGAPWLKIVPWGFRKQLNWIALEYGNPPVLITEIGYSDELSEGLNDISRIYYYTTYMTEMLKSIYEDGCNVIGICAWSLIDNFEWNRGYTDKFGIFKVNFAEPSKPRIPKDSAHVFAEIVRSRQIPARFRNLPEIPSSYGYNVSPVQDLASSLGSSSTKSYIWLPSVDRQSNEIF